MANKSSFLDKVLGRIARLDTEGLQTVVQRLARERSFLETLFNAIEDGVLVVDEKGRILYYNQAVTRLLGLQSNVEGEPITGRAIRVAAGGPGQRAFALDFRGSRAGRVLAEVAHGRGRIREQGPPGRARLG